MSILSYREAFDAWQSDIMPSVIERYGKDDYTALAESWNDYTDMLCKDGQFNDLQYNYCPAWDEGIPDDDGGYILDAMGVAFAYLPINQRPDKLMSDMAPGSTHYRVLIKRGNREMTIHYSQGPAHGTEPSDESVFHSLLTDSSDIESGYEFEEWCDNLGFDSDSRTAERIYKACEEILLNLKILFSDSELSDLREIFEDY